MWFIFILLPVRTLFAHQFLTIPDYVHRVFPAEVFAKFEWINGLNPLIIVIFVPLIAMFTRKANVITMMIIGTTISAATTFLLIGNQPALWVLLTYVTIFSLGEAAWSSRFYEYVGELAPVGQVGAYMGLAGIPWFLAKFTTGLYSGSMLAHFVPKTGTTNAGSMWLIYAFIACVTPIGLILTKKWIEAGHKK
jgi:MFS family permease